MILLLIILFVAILAFVLYEQLSFQAILNRAKKLAESGRHDDAINSLHAGLQRPFLSVPAPQSKIYYAIGTCYADQKAYAKAIKYFEHITSQAASRINTANANDRLQECRLALEELGPSASTYSISVEPETPGLCLNNGIKLISDGKFADAYAMLERGLSLAGDQSSVTAVKLIANLTIASMGVAHPEKAIYWAEKLQDIDGDQSPLLTTHYNAGLSHLNLGNIEAALSHCRKGFLLARNLINTDQEAKYMGLQANILYSQGKIREAQLLAEQAIELGKKSLIMHPTYDVLARLHITRGDYNMALEILDRARDLEPAKSERINRVFARSKNFIRSQVYLKMGDLDRALELVNEVSLDFERDSKNAALAALQKSRILAQQGKSDESRSILEQAQLTISTHFAADRDTALRAMSTSAEVSFYNREPAVAIDQWQNFLRAKPSPVWLATAYTGLGECYEALGDTDKAIDCYRLSVETQIPSIHTKLAADRLAALRPADSAPA